MPTTSPWAFTNGPPELPGLMAASVWMNCPGLCGSSAVRIRAVQRAYDAAGDRKPETEGVAEGKHRLSRTQRGGITDRNVWKVRAVDLDHGQIGERISADQFAGENAPVAERDLDVGGAIHHVVVGNDVTVGRDDNAAADAVFDLRAAAWRWPNCWPKKRCISSGTPSATGCDFAREVTATFTMAGVTRAATASIA